MAALATSARGANASAAAGALARARALVPPSVVATSHGDTEGIDFWEEHASLLEAARVEYGPLDASVYAPGEGDVLGPDGWNVEGTDVPGVYAVRVVSERFLEKLGAELAHLRASGIPLRRPNGMNRHGCILSHLGFEAAIEKICAEALRPLGLRLFPHALRPSDVGHSYAFSVRYEPERDDGDVDLSEHADGAALTMNLCLSNCASAGGDLLFRGVRFHEEDADAAPVRRVKQTPGVALVHLGQHLHAAAPTTNGTRENLIIWAHGEHGYVRIAPYNADGSDGRPFY